MTTSVFFGGPDISVDFLNQLHNDGFTPDLIVTTPDMPAGRKLVMTPPPTKLWAQEHNITVIQPESLKIPSVAEQLSDYDIFIVVAYGKIIPQSILDLPTYGSVNLHPSLLPKYRGPSPIISAMLADDKETGLSLMLLDAEMDHGPILQQELVHIDEWTKNRMMEKMFAERGANLFLATLPQIIDNSIIPQEQDHKSATYCEKFTKADMELNLDEPRQAFLTYCAFPKPFFFYNDIRIVVTSAQYEDNQFIIEKVVPAGKREQPWTDYKRHIDK